MTCKQVHEELLACWGSSDALSMEAREHLRECAQCQREAMLLEETRVLLHSLPPAAAPASFTQAVLARIDAEEVRSGVLARIAGWLVPAGAPAWARAAAVGIGLALAIGGGSVLYQQVAAGGAPVPTVVSDASSVSGVVQATVGTDEIDELLLRHQTLEFSQPLADDPGVSLVMYTSY